MLGNLLFSCEEVEPSSIQSLFNQNAWHKERRRGESPTRLQTNWSKPCVLIYLRLGNSLPSTSRLRPNSLALSPAASPRYEGQKNSLYLCGRALEWLGGKAKSWAESWATLDFGAAVGKISMHEGGTSNTQKPLFIPFVSYFFQLFL